MTTQKQARRLYKKHGGSLQGLSFRQWARREYRGVNDLSPKLHYIIDLSC